MNLNIALSPDAEAKLREQALAAGKDIESFVLDALQQKLGSVSMTPRNGESAKPRSELLGLFADDQSTMDEVMESVYENRAAPLRFE